MARPKRLKLKDEEGFFHIMSWTFGQEFYLGDVEKEKLFNIIQYYSRFSGYRVLFTVIFDKGKKQWNSGGRCFILLSTPGIYQASTPITILLNKSLVPVIDPSNLKYQINHLTPSLFSGWRMVLACALNQWSKPKACRFISPSHRTIIIRNSSFFNRLILNHLWSIWHVVLTYFCSDYCTY